MSQTKKLNDKRPLELVFLGTSAGFLVPIFFCSCDVCETARKKPEHRRTRAVAALIGKETTLIDAGPDLEFQLDREAIKQINRIFITHWHYDHVWGLGSIGGASFATNSPPIEIYLPYQVVHHFDQSFAYLKQWIYLHPVRAGDRIVLPDATWEVVKCNHTPHSIGFIVEATQKFAYLVGSVPPAETIEKLKDITKPLEGFADNSKAFLNTLVFFLDDEQIETVETAL
ncbi:MAG: MBL fold metallo-hydrolase, partial [Pseudomonadota bacterium]